MKNHFTYMQILLDRTGSMSSMKDEVITGFNSFIKQQKELPGDMLVTVVQFDSEEPYEVLYDKRIIEDIPELDERTYVPRSFTPLLESLHKGLTNMIQYMKSSGENRAELCIFVLITDGQENSSKKEFTKQKVRELVKEFEDLGGRMIYLSSDLNGIQDAIQDYGITRSSVTSYVPSNEGVKEMYSVLTKHVSELRTQKG